MHELGKLQKQTKLTNSLEVKQLVTYGRKESVATGNGHKTLLKGW